MIILSLHLRQASHRWNRTLHEYLLKVGFKQHPLDPCLYILSKGDKVLLLGTYVGKMRS